MNSKTILVNYFGRRGSGPEYAYETTRALASTGCRVYALLSAELDNLDKWRQLPLAGIYTVSTSQGYRGAFTKSLRFVARDMRRLFAELDCLGIDACYVPMIHPWSVPVMRHFSRRGARTVFTFHDVWPHKGEINAAYLPVIVGARLMLRWSSDVVLLSRSFVDYVARRFHFPKEHILVLPHAAFTNYDDTNAPAPAPIAHHNFLFFGRIVRYKGLDLLAEAYRRLVADGHRDVSLRIVGSGDFAPYAAVFEGLPRVVVDNRFIAPEEVLSYFRMPGTITVLPYIEASQSGVIPLAMKEDTPLIITDLDGLLEQTDGGRLALVARRDADSLYRQMARAITDPEGCRCMAREAHEYIDSLSWPEQARRLVEAISSPH